MRRIVIVGGGLAAHRAAHALRRRGHVEELVVISDEVHEPYDRPPLSKALLAGEVSHEDIRLSGPEIECDWRLGAAATSLDLAASTVYAGEEKIGYDGLILATGRRARPWPDLPDCRGFYTLRNVEDSAALGSAARPGARVVIVGAGFIGCEVAATLRQRGVADITVVEMARFPMPITGPEVGARAIALHESEGVALRMSAVVDHFDSRDGHVSAVVLQGGERLEADVVLLALGSIPNTEWLSGSGLELVRGAVRVDEHCFALGAENVAAAGDTAAFAYPHAADPVCIEHWATAREMGALAAENMLVSAQERRSFLAVPTFWSDQHDVKIRSAGLLSLADGYDVVEEDPAKRVLVVEAKRGDTVVGAIGFNRPRALIDYQKQLRAELTS